MSKAQLYESIVDLKAKFSRAFVHNKKVKSLENYASVAGLPLLENVPSCPMPFKQRKKLQLLRECINEGFLSEKGAEHLSEMVEDYNICVMKWAHKTKWLKAEMEKIRSYQRPVKEAPITLFDYQDIKVPTYVHDSMFPNPPAASRTRVAQ